MSEKMNRRMRREFRRVVKFNYNEFLKAVSTFNFRDRVRLAWQIVKTNDPKKVKEAKFLK